MQVLHRESHRGLAPQQNHETGHVSLVAARAMSAHNDMILGRIMPLLRGTWDLRPERTS